MDSDSAAGTFDMSAECILPDLNISCIDENEMAGLLNTSTSRVSLSQENNFCSRSNSTSSHDQHHRQLSDEIKIEIEDASYFDYEEEQRELILPHAHGHGHDGHGQDEVDKGSFVGNSASSSSSRFANANNDLQPRPRPKNSVPTPRPTSASQLTTPTIDPPQYVCDQCQFTFPSLLSLKLHELDHTQSHGQRQLAPPQKSSKPWACRYFECKAAFETTALRSKHETTHKTSHGAPKPAAKCTKVKVKPQEKVSRNSGAAKSQVKKTPCLAKVSAKTRPPPKKSIEIENKPKSRRTPTKRKRVAKKKSSAKKGTNENTATSESNDDHDACSTGHGELNSLAPVPAKKKTPKPAEKYKPFEPTITETKLRIRKNPRPTPKVEPEDEEDIVESDSDCKISRSVKSHKTSSSRKSTTTEFLCDQCDRTYKSSRSLQRHMETHKDSSTSSSVSKYSKSTANEQTEGAEVCPHCTKKFRLRRLLIRHLRIHTGEKPFKCRTCDLKFTDTTQRKRHEISQHSDIGTGTEEKSVKIFKCDYEVCKAVFYSESTLATHKKSHGGEKRFSCETCGTKFALQASLRIHKRTHRIPKTEPKLKSKSSKSSKSTSAVVLECCFCPQKFRSLRYLRIHKSKHHRDLLHFTCRICQKEFAKRKYLTRHKLKVHTTTVRHYQCPGPECGKKFSSLHQFQIHQRKRAELQQCPPKSKTPPQVQGGTRVRIRPSFLCENCGRNFRSRDLFEEHKRTYTDETPYWCKKCDVRFAQKSDQLAHFRWAHEDETAPKSFQCQYCPSAFATSERLSRHETSHTKTKTRTRLRLTCDLDNCTRTFASARGLDIHKATHAKPRPFKCDICGFAFTQKQILQRHVLSMHCPEERKYACHFCGRKFVRKVELTTHLVTHSGEKPFKCGVCEEAFRNKDSLRNHVVMQHPGPGPDGDKSFKCQICGKRFPNRRDCETHERSHAARREGVKFKCLFCPTSFSSGDHLAEHLFTKHKIQQNLGPNSSRIKNSAGNPSMAGKIQVAPSAAEK